MPESSTRYLRACKTRRAKNLLASKTRRVKRTHAGKPSWRALGRSREARLELWGLPCSASEAQPGTLPRVSADVQARVDACGKLSWTRCRLGRGTAGIVDRRRWAAGGHHHCRASL
eukprot:4875667-Pyramimonas_sp.AAC.1